MATFLRIWLCLATMVLLAMADSTPPSVRPANATAADTEFAKDNSATLQIQVGQGMVSMAPVEGLNEAARQDVPLTGLSGTVLVTDPSNQLQITSRLVVFISCDVYPGQIQAEQVITQAAQANASAIVLYSRYSDRCRLGYGTNNALRDTDEIYFYTMENKTDTARVLAQVDLDISNASPPFARIVRAAQSGKNGTVPAGASGAAQSDGKQGEPGRHVASGTPSTAVAMIILYAITGIITALFLVIIVTGALRAHRHPERYGPRVIQGRFRQSRARGLARAIVDTLPIVKFGEQRDEPKPADVELADAGEDRTASSDRNVPGTEPAHNEQVPASTQQTAERRQSVEEGIAAATTAQQSSTQAASHDNLGCSICTEDFEPGQDQRVLPCDHKFHPACVDPWLLNVSGTCPLCRIDLRPQASAEGTGELDADGNPVLREPGFDIDTSPPLEPNQATTQQRMGIRRSILEGILGIGGRATTPYETEQRARAFRQYQDQARLEAARQRIQDLPVTAAGEEEGSTRQRLRRVFGIRTRRTGQAEVQDEVEEPSNTPGDRPAEG